MKKIALLVYEEAILSALSGVVDIFSGTNHFLKQTGQPPAFHLELVSEKALQIQLFAPAQFICHKTLHEAGQPDLIIAPAFNGDAGQVLQKNKALVQWLKDMHKKGSEVASLCYGSFLLAESGVLDGKICTSHWQAIDEMQRRYPEVRLQPDAIITDQNGVYTSGGAFSSLNLILYLVEKFCGREVGIQISKMFSIDMDRVNQAHFAVFQGQHNHGDDEVLKAQKFIEQNYNKDISVEQIAMQTHMSTRNFIRRFKKATNNTPLEYLQRVKIEAAKKMLERSSETISILMFEVGYNDAKTFRNVFKRATGLSPQDYRKKYNRKMNAV